MADDTKDRRSSGQKSDPLAASSGGKRPYARLDLKATEIKITPVPSNSQSYAHTAARGTAVPTSKVSSSNDKTPMPAPASWYATSHQTTSAQSPGKASSAASTKQTVGGENTQSAAGTTTSSNTSAPPPSGPAKGETVIVQKRGGFFSHMAAGIIGGVLALAGSEWALPQLGINGTTSRLADDTAAIGQRLQNLEKKPGNLGAIEERLAALEKSAERIPALAEAQTKLAADTKAALASSAGDSAMPEQLARLTTLEDKLKALTEAGANDPNAGRIAQLAALTGKVADLETSLATQLTAFRKGVSDDVDARIASVTASTEAAKSGTQRIDKDVATVKTEAVALTERLAAMKTDNDRLAATLKMAQDETSTLKGALDALKASTAKPTDVAAAVKPVGEKLSAIEQSVQSLMKAEDDRRANSERILLSLELQNLKRALDGGQKYAAELAAVKGASAGKFDLAALEKFKDQGVAGQSELVRDFRAAANAAIDAEVEPAEGGVIDRLVAGAKSVVRVRKINHAADDKSAEAVVGRMEVALKEGRLAEVLAEAKQLPSKSLAAAQPFIDRVNARASVDAAVAAIEAQLKTSLGAGSKATN
jgi:hypothetical protein